MRSWVDRLDHLVRGSHMREALQLALDIYQDKAQAVVGLKHKKEKRQQVFDEYATFSIIGYLTTISARFSLLLVWKCIVFLTRKMKLMAAVT